MSSKMMGPKLPVLKSLRNLAHRISCTSSSLIFLTNLSSTRERASSIRFVGASRPSFGTYANTLSLLAQCRTYSQKAVCIFGSAAMAFDCGSRFAAPNPYHASGRSSKKYLGGVRPGTSRKKARGLARSKYLAISRVIPGRSCMPGEPDFLSVLLCSFLTLVVRGICPDRLAARSRDSRKLDFPVLATPTVSAALMPPLSSR
mmetsp:Transcript_23992/g.70778  ORF Transcript_23992/g.70778 Transcript_23992/m.70778 type:complete len:202 (-) Transcript_23992:598-1203(-)